MRRRLYKPRWRMMNKWRRRRRHFDARIELLGLHLCGNHRMMTKLSASNAEHDDKNYERNHNETNNDGNNYNKRLSSRHPQKNTPKTRLN